MRKGRSRNSNRTIDLKSTLRGVGGVGRHTAVSSFDRLLIWFRANNLRQASEPRLICITRLLAGGFDVDFPVIRLRSAGREHRVFRNLAADKPGQKSSLDLEHASITDTIAENWMGCQ